MRVYSLIASSKRLLFYQKRHNLSRYFNEIEWNLNVHLQFAASNENQTHVLWAVCVDHDEVNALNPLRLPFAATIYTLNSNFRLSNVMPLQIFHTN